MAKFDDLITTVGKFVDVQKGTWDHLEWERLVSKVQRMGYEMSGEIIYNLGTTVEALKRLYLSNTSGDYMTRVVTELPKTIAGFVAETRGMWEHADWLRLLGEVEKAGVSISDETQKYVGDMLEAAKRLYCAPYKEPVAVQEAKPIAVDPVVEIKKPEEPAVAQQSVSPVETKTPEAVKPYETEMKKYIASEVKKHVTTSAKKTASKTAESTGDDEPKAKRPYKKKTI